MMFEQVERHNVDQLRLPLKLCEHLGREARRRVPLRRGPLAVVALGVEELRAIGQVPQAIVDQRP
jgi:hypothetical protein